ncbi:hypothetical protein DL771_010798 [Monosporascus sp. 5C6A]|nr:hypothetical protein DL771_010798 [Monosporascus sp. 5C6A]
MNWLRLERRKLVDINTSAGECKQERVMKNAILKFLRDEQGATAVEYGMIAGLIAAAITVIVGKLGTQLNTVFTNIFLAVLAIALDIRSRRVPNWLVVAGVMLSIALIKFGGVQDLAYDWQDFWLGGAIAFACFLPLYALGWMGAGDVKFFTVVGLLAGWHGLVAVWLVSSMISGLHALGIMMLRQLDASSPSAWIVMRVCPAVARWDTAQAGRRGIPKESAMPTLQREREGARMHPEVRTHAVRRPRRHGGRGAASVEFAIVVPVLLVLMLGIVYYGVILAMQQALTLAAEEGARAALRYQPSNTQRVAAAYAAVTSVLPTFLTGRVQTNQSSTPLVNCQNVAGMQCLSVVLTLPVTSGNNPLLPSIPLLPAPATLTGSAVVQLVPGS